MTNWKKERLINKLVDSRTRLTKEQPFFAVLLMYLRYVIDDNIKKVSTNGRCIAFSSAFLEKLYPTELDFVLCHTALHIALGHIWRPHDLKNDTYHHACDIVVNSMLYECGYEQKRFPHLGSIYRKTSSNIDGYEFTAGDIFASLIYNLDMFDDKTKSKFLFDSDAWWDIKYYSGRRHETLLFSTDEPLEYTAKRPPEKPVQDTPDNVDKAESSFKEKAGNGNGKKSLAKSSEDYNDEEALKQEWDTRVKTARKIAMLLKGDEGFGIGDLPDYEERQIGKKSKPVTNWRAILESFVQEQTCDYSFTPPDKRFGDYDIFLPDFNEKEMVIKDVLFMVDTSGSFSADMIAMAFSEIEGALEQFNGLLSGKVGFFDTEVHAVTDFSSAIDIKKMIPVGGGGTDFRPIFDYVQHEMKNEISSLVVLTDGYGRFPDITSGITYPVLWLINNEDVMPPFGKVARVLDCAKPN